MSKTNKPQEIETITLEEFKERYYRTSRWRKVIAERIIQVLAEEGVLMYEVPLIFDNVKYALEKRVQVDVAHTIDLADGFSISLIDAVGKEREINVINDPIS